MHDEAAAAHRHPAGDGAGQPEGADEVHLQHAGEVLALGVEEQPQRRGAEGARVVDEDVDRPGQGRGRARDAMDVLLGADVGGERVGLAALARGSRAAARSTSSAFRATSTTRAPARASAAPSAAPQPAARLP